MPNNNESRETKMQSDTRTTCEKAADTTVPNTTISNAPMTDTTASKNAPPVSDTGRSADTASPKHTRRGANAKLLLRRLTVTAVCTAFAVVLKCFTNLALNIPALGIKVGFGGIFTFFPAAICGPLWGGAACALSDLLGHFIAPDGAYIPWLTITAFAGGCIIGILWRAVGRRYSRPLRVALISFFAVVLFFGQYAAISLKKDGVTDGFTASAAELPTRTEIDEMELSSVSEFVVGLSRYSKDSKNITLKALPSGAAAIPAALTVDGEERKVTAVSSGALENAGERIYIPATCKTIPDDALGDRDPKTLTIVTTGGSPAATFAANVGAPLDIIGEDDTTAYAVSLPSVFYVDAHAVLEYEGYAFTQSDTYRKNLAGNINFATVGCTAIGIAGILFVLLNILTAHIEARRQSSDGDSRSFTFLKIALCVTVAGLVVTTVNTFILRIYLPAWSGRAILVLLIPRVIEEVVVRLFQAYVISLLMINAERAINKIFPDSIVKRKN